MCTVDGADEDENEEDKAAVYPDSSPFAHLLGTCPSKEKPPILYLFFWSPVYIYILSFKANSIWTRPRNVGDVKMSSLPFNNNPDLRQSQHHRLHHPQPQSPGESLWRARNSQGLPGYGLQSQSGPGAGAISSKLNGIFGSGRVLPMYKDKPYFAPRRTGPRLRRRRALLFGVVIFFVIAGLWWYDVWGIAGDGKWRLFGSSKASEVDKGAELWKWLQSLKEGTDETIIQKKGGGITKTKAFADWNARREKVRDAFVVSWDGYEKYAWGMFFSSFL